MGSCSLRLKVIRQADGRIAEILACAARNGNQNEAFQAIESVMLAKLSLGIEKLAHLSY
jgi:hypothetical protein